MSFEIRLYRLGTGSGKSRIATIKKSDKWFGLVAWIRLWFTLRKAENRRRNERRQIAADCSPQF